MGLQEGIDDAVKVSLARPALLRATNHVDLMADSCYSAVVSRRRGEREESSLIKFGNKV